MVGTGKKQPTRLGAYEIIRPLARGGMAELFLVRATGPEGFEKVLVLKRILPHFAENPRFVRSFLDEAKLVAGFDHPHIAHVHDMGKVDGSYFFTMEFVHGVDVRSVLKRCKRNGSQFPIELSVLIGRNIASALHYAHERRSADGTDLNVVHRDVSPSNVIVSYDGVPKLIDFGIAKADSSSIKTQTGALKGKISYMSPEQAKGAPLDRRTDIFALGIVLWEMITGRRLYKCDNDMATIQRIIYAPPPSPRSVRTDCPPALERIILRALALDIKSRYQTAEELQVELEDFAFEHRMKQSSIALSVELKRLFDDELKAFAEAQVGSATVTDAIAIAPGGDATRSDSLEYLVAPPPDEDDEDDEDDDSVAATTSNSKPHPPVPSPPELPQAFTSEPSPVATSDAPVAAAELRSGAIEMARTTGRLTRERHRTSERISPRRGTLIWGTGLGLAAIIGIVVVVSASRGDERSAPAVQAADPVRMNTMQGPEPVIENAPTAPVQEPAVALPATPAITPNIESKPARDSKVSAAVKKEVTPKKEIKPLRETKLAVTRKKETKQVRDETKLVESKPVRDETKPAREETKPPKKETKPKFDPKEVFPPSS